MYGTLRRHRRHCCRVFYLEMARLAFASVVTSFLYFADKGAEPPEGVATLQKLNDGSNTLGLGPLLGVLNAAVPAQGVAPLQTINDGLGALLTVSNGTVPPQGVERLQTLNDGSRMPTLGLGTLVSVSNGTVPPQGVAPLQTLNDGSRMPTLGLPTLVSVSNGTVPPEGVATLPTLSNSSRMPTFSLNTRVGISNGTVQSEGVAPLRTLNDGSRMPTLGLGTLLGITKIGEVVKALENQVVRAVEIAIDAGYRLIDTSAIYGTEDQVGQGVKNKIEDGTVKREDVYVVTKVWNNQHARSEVVKSLRDSLQKLAMDYVDLFLIHWPVAYTKNRTIENIDYLETWKGMEDAKRLGLTKSIGLSNFNEQQIDRVFNNSEIKPAVLQVEVNLNLSQRKLLEYARAKGLLVMAYAPFGALVPLRATPDTPPPKLDDPDMVKIAKKLGKTVPQVVLRYLLDKGVTPIPKSVTPSHIIENIDVFDFQLSPEDTALLDSYNRDYRVVRPDFFEHHPDYPFEKIH